MVGMLVSLLPHASFSILFLSFVDPFQGPVVDLSRLAPADLIVVMEPFDTGGPLPLMPLDVSKLSCYLWA